MDIPRQPRYASLDFWRGVACLSVIVFHLTIGYTATQELKREVLFGDGGTFAEHILVFTSYCWFGVPLFFVISGYCIAAAADSARRRPKPVGQFFFRRFKRIYPPLWITLAVFALVVAFLPRSLMPPAMDVNPHPLAYPQDVSWVNWLGAITLTEEWRWHIGGPPRDYFTSHIWSLCYEEQFYAITGLLLLVARKRFFQAVLVVTLLVYFRLEYMVNMQTQRAGAFYDGHWIIFAAGVGIYYRVNYATKLGQWGIDAGIALLLLWMGQRIGPFVNWLWFGPMPETRIVQGLFFALLLSWLHKWDGYIANARLLAPITFCGRMCYSLYLSHAVLLILFVGNLYKWGVTSPTQTLLITVPTGLALSVFVGWVFFHLVEKRFLNAPIPMAKPTSREESATDTPLTQTPPPIRVLAGVVPEPISGPNVECAGR